jgi:hypothetical protein
MSLLRAMGRESNSNPSPACGFQRENNQETELVELGGSDADLQLGVPGLSHDTKSDSISRHLSWEQTEQFRRCLSKLVAPDFGLLSVACWAYSLRSDNGSNAAHSELLSTW